MKMRVCRKGLHDKCKGEYVNKKLLSPRRGKTEKCKCKCHERVS